MPAIGGEVDQLTALKSTFDRQAANVAELVSSIDSQINSTYWVGPAAERFKGQWSGDFKRMLTNLQGALGEAGTEVARRRDALIKAGS
jgi:uncharacterized protein YukE